MCYVEKVQYSVLLQQSSAYFSVQEPVKAQTTGFPVSGLVCSKTPCSQLGDSWQPKADKKTTEAHLGNFSRLNRLTKKLSFNHPTS